MIEVRMTADETRDYYGSGPITQSTPWGCFRIRAQRRAKDTGATVKILTYTGDVVCTVCPTE